ncbi:hypothetical protein WM40_25090 [Robbsia andropogonis]|uniref:Cellulose synthase n=1 Tax=Robbsia andropogonis TaxID=28092 RepID=A0A0F5JTH6_9BURK|nr:hypothetical protein [Robbsia andropogonis]KKB61113.1 hypothetical protein WM40_25090 [Robbsia andropogonis]
MATRQKLQIVGITERTGVSAKTGKPYCMRTAQCILHQEKPEGTQLVVGTILLPNEVKGAAVGEFLADFEFMQSRDGALVPTIVELHPYGSSTQKPTAKAGQGLAATA